MTVAAVLLSLAAVGHVSAVSWSGDQWIYNPLLWSIRDQAFRSSGHKAGLALLQAAPISQRVSVEADVELTHVDDDETWKIAGVAIVADPRNFWHFAMVLPPAGQKQIRTCELSEMRDGVWLSQNNLKQVVRESKHKSWQMGSRYRMRIVLDPKGVEGTLADPEGHVFERIRYEFSGEAIKVGRPAIRSEGFEATFSNISIEHSDPAPLAPPTIVPYASKSFVEAVGGKKTGFFHVEKHGDRWWVIDPLGRGFVPLGVDHVSFHGHWCKKLGYAPYGKKNKAKYPDIGVWNKETLDRLQSWGFNLLGACYPSPDLHHRGLAHTTFLAIGESMADSGQAMCITPALHIPGTAFPNVFHPDFETFCRFYANQACKQHLGDPWLFGYFLDNELAWRGTNYEPTGLCDAVMQMPADHTAKRALRDFLAKRYGNDIARLNQAWAAQFNSFDDILHCKELSGGNAETVLADKEAFVSLIGERYFEGITRAIRAVDPNHMILGCRFAGGRCSDGVWQAAGRHCDIVSFNYYGNVDLNHGIARDDESARAGKPLPLVFQKFYDACRRPMMVTEWSFPALDAGLPSRHGAGQRFHTQAERTHATEITARTMLSLPFLVGYDYFMWVDEPALGISEKFPEDSNYGLVNEDGKPYELLTAAFTRIHADAARLRREGPSCAGVPMDDSGFTSSRLVRFLEKPLSKAADGAKADPALQFERQGDNFTAANDAWEIAGRIGGNEGLTTLVRHRGLPMGRFGGMVQQCNGENRWIDAQRLVDVHETLGATAMTIDLMGRFDAPAGEPLRRSFEAAYRLTLEPNRDWFTAQLLWYRNTSKKPVDIQAFYFRLYSAIGGSSDNDVPIAPGLAPRVWGRVVGDGWLNKKAGAFWGLLVDDVDPLQIYFWLDENQGQHPDACLKLERRLEPGETFRPATPIGVICIGGRGGQDEWSAQTRKALESLDK